MSAFNNGILDATSNLDYSTFKYSTPKANPVGGKVVNVTDPNTTQSILLQLPKITSWGAQEVLKQTEQRDPATGKPISVGTGKYTMALQFQYGDYSTPESLACLEQLKRFEAEIKRVAMERSKEWFGKVITSADVIEEKFTPMLKYPKKEAGSDERDYERAPSLNIKIPKWSDVWQPSVFADDDERTPLYIKNKVGESPLPHLTLESKAPIKVACLIQCAGLWFVNGKVSITWNLKQCVVSKSQLFTIPDEECFMPPTKMIAQPSISSVIVDDSDDEGEPTPQVVETVAVEAVEEPVVATPPPPVEDTKKGKGKGKGK